MYFPNCYLQILHIDLCYNGPALGFLGDRFAFGLGLRPRCRCTEPRCRRDCCSLRSCFQIPWCNEVRNVLHFVHPHIGRTTIWYIAHNPENQEGERNRERSKLKLMKIKVQPKILARTIALFKATSNLVIETVCSFTLFSSNLSGRWWPIYGCMTCMNTHTHAVMCLCEWYTLYRHH